LIDLLLLDITGAISQLYPWRGSIGKLISVGWECYRDRENIADGLEQHCCTTGYQWQLTIDKYIIRSCLKLCFTCRKNDTLRTGETDVCRVLWASHVLIRLVQLAHASLHGIVLHSSKMIYFR